MLDDPSVSLRRVERVWLATKVRRGLGMPRNDATSSWIVSLGYFVRPDREECRLLRDDLIPVGPIVSSRVGGHVGRNAVVEEANTGFDSVPVVLIQLPAHT